MKPRFVAIWLSTLLAASLAAFAGPNDGQQISAARLNAIASLRAQVEAIRLTGNISVDDFLNQTQSGAAVAALAGKAHTLGGPRWIDEQTVQVKLELSGAELIDQLISIAATHPQGPVSPVLLEQRLKYLRNVSLIGTGTSVADAPTIRPPGMSDAWVNVSEEQRSAAVATARQDASDQLIHDVAAIALANGQTAGDLMKREAIRSNVRGWLDTRPPGNVRYTDDLGVQLELSASQADLIDRIVTAARAAGVAVDTQQIESVGQKFDQKTLVAVGHASAATAAALPGNANLLPDTPPGWTAQPIDAQGASARQRTPLLTKHAAEADATQALRAQICTLRLGASRTIGDAAATDPRVESAIASALLRAHVYRVENRPDGSWRVRITLDTRDLWEELTQAVGP